jgi:ribosomal protein S25
VNDFLDEKRREISERLKRLQPAVDEFRRLEAAAAALAGVGGAARASASPAAKKGRRKGPGRPRGSAAKTRAAKATATATATKATTKRKPARRRAGRRKGSGTRAAEALKFVQGQPGVTIPELAAKMGIKQNYLYRVLPGLESEGKVSKSGRGWHARKA